MVDWGISATIAINVLFSYSIVLGLIHRINFFRIPQKSSIGERSGELADQSTIKFTLSLSQSTATWDV
jgi:hypothetical protein